MHPFNRLPRTLAFYAVLSPFLFSQPADLRPIAPPIAPVRPVVDEYHGIQVVDPYRYMETAGNPEVQSWVEGQAEYTRRVLSAIPGREKLLSRLVELAEARPAVVSDVHRYPGDVYVYLKRLAKESTARLYLRKGLNGDEILLLDPVGVTSWQRRLTALA